LGVSGTPTLVLDSGQVIPGYVPAEKLVAGFGQDGSKK
jgi:protein-disulfide isomerase